MDKSRDLLDAISDELLKVVKEGVVVVDGEGNIHRNPAPAQYLAVAAKLVKDFPPRELPTKVAPTGILAEHMKKLPFGRDEGEGLRLVS